MVIVTCKVCKKEFKAKPSHIKNGYAKYCSRACGHEGMRKGTYKNCSVCGTSAYKTKKQLKNSMSGKFFCGKSCQTKWRNTFFSGKKHANWKHGRNVYRTILKKTGRKEICQICKTTDTRVLVVHHIDRDRENNTADNLAWLCCNCHFLVHHYNAGEGLGL